MTKQNEYQDQRITKLEDKFSTMCDNHAHDVAGIKVDISSIKANQKFLVWFMLAEIAAMIGLFFEIIKKVD